MRRTRKTSLYAMHRYCQYRATKAHVARNRLALRFWAGRRDHIAAMLHWK